VRVVLPASGCEMMAKVLRFSISLDISTTQGRKDLSCFFKATSHIYSIYRILSKILDLSDTKGARNLVRFNMGLHGLLSNNQDPIGIRTLKRNEFRAPA